VNNAELRGTNKNILGKKKKEHSNRRGGSRGVEKKEMTAVGFRLVEESSREKDC